MLYNYNMKRLLIAIIFFLVPFNSFAVTSYSIQTNGNQGVLEHALTLNPLMKSGVFMGDNLEEVVTGYNFFKATSTYGSGAGNYQSSYYDTSTCYAVSSSSRSWVLSYYTGSIINYHTTYTNQSGTVRNINRSADTGAISIGGLNYYLNYTDKLSTLGYGADTCVKNVKYSLNNGSRVGFVVITDVDLSYINTEQEVLDYIDSLNSSPVPFSDIPIGKDVIVKFSNPVIGGTIYSTSSPLEFAWWYDNTQYDYVQQAILLTSSNKQTQYIWVDDINDPESYYTAEQVDWTSFVGLPLSGLPKDTYNLKYYLVSGGVSTTSSLYADFEFTYLADTGVEDTNIFNRIANYLASILDYLSGSQDGVIVTGNDYEALKYQVYHKFPLGYFTDFYDILATTTTNDLPVLSFTLPRALQMGNSSIVLDPNNSLDWILYATSTIFNDVGASSTATFYEITEPYWEILVYLSAFLYILSRVFVSSGLFNDILGNRNRSVDIQNRKTISSWYNKKK